MGEMQGQNYMSFSQQQLDNHIERTFYKLVNNECKNFDKTKHNHWYMLAIIGVLAILILIGSLIWLWLAKDPEEKKWIKIIALVLLVLISLPLLYQLKTILF